MNGIDDYGILAALADLGCSVAEAERDGLITADEAQAVRQTAEHQHAEEQRAAREIAARADREARAQGRHERAQTALATALPEFDRIVTPGIVGSEYTDRDEHARAYRLWHDAACRVTSWADVALINPDDIDRVRPAPRLRITESIEDAGPGGLWSNLPCHP